MTHIFISYSSKNRDLITELADDLDLLVDDCWVWYDRELNRSGGHQWWNLILQEIRRCDVFIYALSPQVLTSEPCRREYGYARALGKSVLPVVVADTEIRHLPVELQAAQLVNYRQRSRDQQRSLKESIRNLPSAPPLPEPLPTPPDAPLDPVGVLFDRITRLTADPDAQKYLIVDIEDLNDEDAFQKHVPELLQRLLDRDDVLTQRNSRRAQELLAKTQSITSPSPAPTVGTGFFPSAAPPTSTRRLYELLPAPFALLPIPAGQVTLIENYDDKSYFGKKGDKKTFSVAAFEMGKYPVTNAQYAEFIKAEGYTHKPWWTDAGWQQREKEGWVEPRYWQDAKWNGADYPVVGVSWYEALAFCRWLREVSGENISLPTEQQWQRAAQGDDGRAYPWGADWDVDRCNNSVGQDWQQNQTSPVTRYEGQHKGDSPFGVVDMSGNVWEWCLTEYETGSQDENRTGVRVLRGGSWYNLNPDNFRADYRSRNTPVNRNLNWGFRIARS